MAKKARLDKARPYATISSLKPQKAVYEQDGVLFDNDGVECGKVDGYDERKRREAEAAAKKSEDKKAAAAAASAEEILGDLGADPNAEAQRENAAAAAAEESADDA